MDFEITPEDAKSMTERKDPFTLRDVRESWEFETARIEGASLIPMGDIPSRAHHELDPEAHIIVYCHHGVRSMTVTAWPPCWSTTLACSLAPCSPPVAKAVRLPLSMA